MIHEGRLSSLKIATVLQLTANLKPFVNYFYYLTLKKTPLYLQHRRHDYTIIVKIALNELFSRKEDSNNISKLELTTSLAGLKSKQHQAFTDSWLHYIRVWENASNLVANWSVYIQKVNSCSVLIVPSAKTQRCGWWTILTRHNTVPQSERASSCQCPALSVTTSSRLCGRT